MYVFLIDSLIKRCCTRLRGCIESIDVGLWPSTASMQRFRSKRLLPVSCYPDNGLKELGKNKDNPGWPVLDLELGTSQTQALRVNCYMNLLGSTRFITPPFTRILVLCSLNGSASVSVNFRIPCRTSI